MTEVGGLIGRFYLSHENHKVDGSINGLHLSNDKPPPGPNPAKTKPKSDDQLKRSAKPASDRPHLQIADSYHYCWSLLRQYTFSIHIVPIIVL